MGFLSLGGGRSGGFGVLFVCYGVVGLFLPGVVGVVIIVIIIGVVVIRVVVIDYSSCAIHPTIPSKHLTSTPTIHNAIDLRTHPTTFPKQPTITTSKTITLLVHRIAIGLSEHPKALLINICIIASILLQRKVLKLYLCQCLFTQGFRCRVLGRGERVGAVKVGHGVVEEVVVGVVVSVPLGSAASIILMHTVPVLLPDALGVGLSLL